MDVTAHVTAKAQAAKEAARALALASTRAKNEALLQMARGLEELTHVYDDGKAGASGASCGGH